MKFFFFIALLMNIIFFLWESNSGGFNSRLEMTDVDSHQIKQILLVSELSSQDGGDSLIIAENKTDLYGQLLVPLESSSAIQGKTEEDTRESSKQLIKNSATAIEEFPENLISSNELPQNDQAEQNTLQHDVDTQATSDQVDSKQLIKSSTTANEESPESLISSNELPQNDQTEQNTLQHDADTQATSDQLDSKEGNKQLIMSSAVAIEESPEKLLSSNEQPQNDQTEQNTLQHDADTQSTGDQLDSKEASKQLIMSSNTAIKEFPENLISSNELPQNDQSEQNILQYEAASIVTSDQLDSKESRQQLIKSSIAAIEQFPGTLISLNIQAKNDQSEQNILQHNPYVLGPGGQINSVPIIPVLEEKPLAGESHKDVIVNSVLDSGKLNREQADPDNNSCYHVGPFANQDALNIWRKLNKIDKDSVSRFNKEIDVVSRYLVYFPAAETFSQSRKNVQRLKQKGITDYWLFRRGELRGAISLGLFAKKSRALSMQEKLVKAGFAIEMKERYKKEQLLYAEISTKEKAFKDRVIISDKQGISECKNNTGKQE